ncbi:hypothetical protein RsoM2USA_68 [Ralstonia phage RsoM2USA]|nr:hypothetical protein RsoM2USA_68 [Ralstonia phage RsoM2USA]
MDFSRRLKFLAGLCEDDQDYGLADTPDSSDVPPQEPADAEPTADMATPVSTSSYCIFDCPSVSEKLNQAAAKLDDVLAYVTSGNSASPDQQGSVELDAESIKSTVNSLKDQIKALETQVDAAYAKMVNVQGEKTNDSDLDKPPVQNADPYEGPVDVNVDVEEPEVEPAPDMTGDEPPMDTDMVADPVDDQEWIGLDGLPVDAPKKDKVEISLFKTFANQE